MSALFYLTDEQESINQHIKNFHPDDPIVFEMQKRFRELEQAKN